MLVGKSERMQCYGFVWGEVNNGAEPWILYPGKAPSGSQLDLWRLTSPYSLFFGVEYRIESV